MSTTTTQNPPRLKFVDDGDGGGGTVEVQPFFASVRFLVAGSADDSPAVVLMASRAEARDIAQFILDVTEEA